MMDIALPKNNEAEFVEIAAKLYIKKLYFLYDIDNYNQQTRKNLESIEKQSKIDIETGFIVNHKNISKALQHSKFLVAKSSDKDRQIIESRKIKIIYGFEEVHKKDYLHQRASGLNHVLCELARKNNVAVGFSYSSLLNKNPETTLIMGRMIQNIALCQKYHVKTIIASFATNPFGVRVPHDIASLFSLLGMSDKNIKDSVTISL